MASKNASLGALDALRTKVRDKSDTNDKKQVKDSVPVAKKDEEMQEILTNQNDDQTVKSSDDSVKKKLKKSQPVSIDPESTTTAAPVPDLNKKKKAGRKKIADNKKRVQITLTISHSANDRLTEWASDMPKSGSRLLSDYIDYHLEDIINYYNKII